MKKKIAMIVVFTLILTFTVGAATAGRLNWGSCVIPCVKYMETYLINQSTQKSSEAKSGSLYVRHYLYGNYSSLTPYNNYFRALCTDTEHIPSGHSRSELVGDDWMTPGEANYVRSSQLKPNKWMSAWARANTDYGLSHIEISGYFTTEG